MNFVEDVDVDGVVGCWCVFEFIVDECLYFVLEGDDVLFLVDFDV